VSGDRDANGRFQLGHSPLGGRPRGFKAVAAEIMRRTADGVALVDYAIARWQDLDATPDERWQAFCWLSDRGMGRPVSVVDAALAVEATSNGLPLGWSQMSEPDRRQWIAERTVAALPAGR